MSKEKALKIRDPNWKMMMDLRGSSASGSHKNKKKELPRKKKYKEIGD